MNEKLECRIDPKLKEEYKEYVEKKYDKKWGKTGLEITKAMKFHLAINGNSKYQDDPDVQALLKKTKQIKSTPKNTKESLEDKIDKLTQKVEQLEKKTQRESSKKHGHAEFKKQFQMAFQDYHQASKKDIEQFIINHADIVDKRSIQSRIHYLESHGMIESFAPNVYNVKK